MTKAPGKPRRAKDWAKRWKAAAKAWRNRERVVASNLRVRQEAAAKHAELVRLVRDYFESWDAAAADKLAAAVRGDPGASGSECRARRVPRTRRRSK